MSTAERAKAELEKRSAALKQELEVTAEKLQSEIKDRTDAEKKKRALEAQLADVTARYQVCVCVCVWRVRACACMHVRSSAHMHLSCFMRAPSRALNRSILHSVYACVTLVLDSSSCNLLTHGRSPFPVCRTLSGSWRR